MTSEELRETHRQNALRLWAQPGYRMKQHMAQLQRAAHRRGEIALKTTFTDPTTGKQLTGMMFLGPVPPALLQLKQQVDEAIQRGDTVFTLGQEVPA